MRLSTAMKTQPSKRAKQIALVLLGSAVVFGTHLTLFSYYLDHHRMGADEGFYAIAARNVMEGKIPYRDFAYTQMPLLPYLNGVMMEIFGYGLLQQRAINIGWSCVGLLAIILAVRQRLGRWEPGFVAAFTVAASPHFVGMLTMGNTHGSAVMFLALSTAAVLTTFSLNKRIIGFAVFATMAMGCRLSTLSVIVPLGIVLLYEAKNWRQRIFIVALPTGVAIAALLPFFLAAPQNAVFNVWEYHMSSVFDRRRWNNFIQWWCISPAAILVIVSSLGTLPRLIKDRQWNVLLLLFAGIAGITIPMIPKSSYGNYIVPSVLVAAAMGVTAWWTIARANGSLLRHVVWVLPLLVLFHDLPRVVPEGTSTNAVKAADFLRDHVVDGPILTPLPIVAIEAQRQVLPNTEMGMFCSMHPDEKERALSLKLTTLPLITDSIKKRVPKAIVMMTTGSRWNFMWIVPTLKHQPRRAHYQLTHAIKKYYRKAFVKNRLQVFVPRRNPLRDQRRGPPKKPRRMRRR